MRLATPLTSHRMKGQLVAAADPAQAVRNTSHASRKAIYISTYNVRTLGPTGKLHQLITGCVKNNIDIVAVQEHRWQTSESVSTHEEHLDGETWRFEYSSATPQGQGGVGLLISPKFAKLFASSEKISERLMRVSFKGNPATTIIVAYAPTLDKTDDIKEAFYNDLHTCSAEIPPHTVVIAAGDFNARIGKDSHHSNSRAVGRYSYHEETNDNGARLVNYSEACNMRSVQFRFPHPAKYLWTWMHANQTSKAQLDHILISGKWINSIENVRAYNCVELNSDHRILSAKVKISLRAPKELKCKRIKYNWSSFIDGSALRAQYEVEV